jgi:hypothetical protein
MKDLISPDLTYFQMVPRLMAPWTNQMEKGQGKLPAPGGQHHKVFQHGQQKTFAKPPGTDEQPGFSGFKKRDFSGRSPGYNS